MQVGYEFGLVCDRNTILEDFNKAWKEYTFKVLAYALSHTSPTKDLKNALRDVSDDNDIDDLKVGEYSTPDIEQAYTLRHAIDLHVHESCMRVAVRVLHSSAFIYPLYRSGPFFGQSTN